MELIAQKREELGKKSKKLIEDRMLPAVMFAKGMSSLNLTVDLNKFLKVYKEAGESTLVDVVVDGKAEKVLIKDVQMDPQRGNPIHASFHKVNLKEKITAGIEVQVEGDTENALVKSGEALVLVLLNEITVEALPTDLPNHFTVNVASLAEIGDGIKVSELEYDRSKVKVVDVDEDEFIVKLDKAEMEETAEDISEAEALAKIEATKELTEEEKAAKAAKDSEKKAEKDK